MNTPTRPNAYEIPSKQIVLSLYHSFSTVTVFGIYTQIRCQKCDARIGTDSKCKGYV